MTNGGQKDVRPFNDFNPHPHAEGDGTITKLVLDKFNFNPHPHAEGDYTGYGSDMAKGAISIHTLTQRVTNWFHFPADSE